jgi:hypothetical protein
MGGDEVVLNRMTEEAAPPAWVRGAIRCWEEIGVRIRCLSPFTIGSALPRKIEEENGSYLIGLLCWTQLYT